MKPNIITISFSLVEHHQVILGFTFPDNPEEYLFTAFSFDGEWHIHKYHLGASELKFNEPEEDLSKLFTKLLNIIQARFIGKTLSFRREKDIWAPKFKLVHETNPTKIEMPAGNFQEAEELDNLVRMCGF